MRACVVLISVFANSAARVGQRSAWQACALRLGCTASGSGRGASVANASTEPEQWLCQAMARLYLLHCVAHSPLISQMDAERSSCAVVGSSSVLLGARLGAEIDAHSVIIRANLAPLMSDGRQVPPFGGGTRMLQLNRGDFREDVGARTTGRVINRQHGAQLADELKAGTDAQYLERVRTFVGDSAPVELVLAHGKAFVIRLRMARVSRRCLPDAAALGDGASQLQAPTALVLPLPQVDGPGSVTSSGLVAVLLALSRCHSLTAYGFGEMRRAGFSEAGRPLPQLRAQLGNPAPGAGHQAPRFHYYQNHTRPVHQRHAFSAEHELLRALARGGCFSSQLASQPTFASQSQRRSDKPQSR